MQVSSVFDIATFAREIAIFVYEIVPSAFAFICRYTITKVVKIKKNAKMFGAFPEKHYLCSRKLIQYG